MNGNFDLHSHSTASDGSLTPSELVERAHGNGVDVLALTDHDEVSGIDDAWQKATELGMGFVPGIEISVSWAHQTFHILGLGIDPGNLVLRTGLDQLQAFRHWRSEEISRRLEKANIHGALEGAKAFCKGNILSRTHFAHFLVKQGYARDIKQVFRRFLVRGKPGHVPGEWASLEEALGWIQTAGGMAVIAHPARYSLSATRLRQFIAEFIELGGAGFEAISGSHSRDEENNMLNMAKKYNLLVSCGSDFHGPENPYRELGQLSSIPEDCTPVWASKNWPGVWERRA